MIGNTHDSNKLNMSIDKEDIYCPITKQIFFDPVIIGDGHTYEREAVTQWFKHNATSPLTGERLPNKNYVDNRWLKNRIGELLSMNEEMKKEQYQLLNCLTLNEILSIRIDDIGKKLFDVNRVILGTVQRFSYNKLKSMLKNSDKNTITILEKVDFELEHNEIGLMFISNILKFGSNETVMYLIHKLTKNDFDYYNNLDVKNYSKPIFDMCKRRGDLIDIVIGKGYNIDFKTKNSGTILHELCLYSNCDIIGKLFRDYPDAMKRYVDAEDQGGETPIFYACENSDDDLIKLLVENGADPNKKIAGECFIHRYIGQKNGMNIDINMLKYFVSIGVNMDVTDICGNKPIFYLCESGNVTIDMIEILSANPENLYCENYDGDNILHILFSSNPILDVTIYLIETRNVPYNVFNKQGCTPVHILCKNIGKKEKCKDVLTYMYTKDKEIMFMTTGSGCPLDILINRL